MDDVAAQCCSYLSLPVHATPYSDFTLHHSVYLQLERFFKLNLYGHDPDGLSAIEPVQYRDRFLRKVEDILTSDYAHQSRFAPVSPPATLHAV